MKRKQLGVAAAIGALAAALILVLTACGGGGDSDAVASLNGTSGQGVTSDSGTEGKKDPEDAALEYARCMRAHGVDVPDPSPNGGGIQLSIGPKEKKNKKKIDEAQKACQDILESARPQLSEEQQSLLEDAALALAKCMREHGIDMPDPQFGKGGIVTQKQRARNGFRPDDPKFQEAQKACAPIMEEARQKAGLPEGGVQRSGGGS